jgi:hypothetical protein
VMTPVRDCETAWRSQATVSETELYLGDRARHPNARMAPSEPKQKQPNEHAGDRDPDASECDLRHIA